MKNNLAVAIQASLKAGKAILEVYSSDDINVEVKGDDSPLTKADKNANDVINSFLLDTQIPIIKNGKNNDLLLNEIAPRVHNSGHLTINAFNISQFEGHVRAVCNLEIIAVGKNSKAAEMINILGKEIEEYRLKNFNENEFFFDYGKKEIKDKRKMGHLTILKK